MPKEAAFILAKRLGYNGKDSHEALETIKKSSTHDILAKTPGIIGELEVCNSLSYTNLKIQFDSRVFGQENKFLI